MEILLGFAIALLVGTTGMGGGSLTVPLLILGLGMPAGEAVGTALLFAVLAKVVALPVYVTRREVDYRIGAIQLIGGLPGVWLGAVILNRMNTATLQPYLLTLVGFTIVALALASLWKSLRGGAVPVGNGRVRWLPWIAFPIGIEVGFSSAGAGALGALSLMYCTPLRAAKVVGTDLLFGLLLSLAGGGLHLAAGNVNPEVLWKLSAGGVLGAGLGAWLATRIPSRPLRTALTAFLIFLGGQLSWKGVAAVLVATATR